jgi:catechol 2,3-dioxygenase-like lactoylglutathione lyase family enzyme
MDGRPGLDWEDERQKLARLVDGIHDVRIPVADPWVSRAWYASTLGFEPVLDLQEEPGLVGVVLRHRSGFVIGLHRDPGRARTLRGFVVLALTVPHLAALERCVTAFDRLGQEHSEIREGHLGWHADVPDPDGVLVRLHTATSFDADEA